MFILTKKKKNDRNSPTHSNKGMFFSNRCMRCLNAVSFLSKWRIGERRYCSEYCLSVCEEEISEGTYNFKNWNMSYVWTEEGHYKH